MSKRYTKEFDQFNQFLGQKPDLEQLCPINKPLFAYILSEYFTYIQQKYKNLKDLEYITTCEDCLQKLGNDIGFRMWEAFLIKTKFDQSAKQQEPLKCEQDVLKIVQKQFWPYLFGKEITKNVQLQVIADNKGFYFIETNPITDLYISYPKDYNGIQPSALLSGIIQSCLSSSGFECSVKVFLNQGQTYYEIQPLKK